MTEAAPTTANEQWLILTDYASKYKISVSTLRRRIKANQIRHRFEAGKYLIFDTAPEDVPMAAPVPTPSIAHQMAQDTPIQTSPQSLEAEVKLKELSQGEEPILSTATRLLNELKRAYTNILQEKEEQMILLKEEVADLKTLVRVLESDNDRMRKILQGWGNA
jgi:hypothetical protein